MAGILDVLLATLGSGFQRPPEDVAGVLDVSGPIGPAMPRNASGQEAYGAFPIPTPVPSPIDNQVGIPAPQASQDEWAATVNKLAASMGIPNTAASTPTQPANNSGNVGADRVNANTTNTGIRAVIGQDGKVTLTNVVGKDPMAYGAGIKTIQKGGTSYDAEGNIVGEQQATPDQKRLQVGVQGLLNQIRTAKDGDSALGIYVEFNNAYAQERAKMYNDALQTANRSLQIPELERQLMNEMALDKQDPENTNGMRGDSPITMKVRAQLEQARGLADTEAKRLLAGNLHYSSLESAAKNAEMEVKRITANSDRLQNMADNATMRKQVRADERAAIADEKAAALPEEVKKRMVYLDPTLDASDNVKLMHTLEARQSKKDGFVEALEQPDELLPVMAISGNVYAKTILTQKEKDAGIPQDVTAARLQRIKSLETNPDTLKKGLAIINQGASADQIKAIIGNVNAMNAPGGNKQEGAKIKQQAVMAVYKEQVQEEFFTDVSKWGIQDPEILTAMTESQKVTGRTDLQGTMVEYMGKAVDPSDRARRMGNMIKVAQQAALSTNGSLLGSIDPVMAGLQVQSIETRSLMQRMLGGLEARDGMIVTPAGVVTRATQSIAQPIRESLLGAFSAHNKPKE